MKIFLIEVKTDELLAVSPVDGRYHSKTQDLAGYFSEFALIRYRVRVEIEYFTALCELPLPQLSGVPADKLAGLAEVWKNFSVENAARIKEIEKVTNHDVKAVEYFIKERFDLEPELVPYKEFIHFGLTSQDINNTAVPLMIKEALRDVYVPGLQKLIDKLNEYADAWDDIPMLARTHGQPASPTRLGKEIRASRTLQ